MTSLWLTVPLVFASLLGITVNAYILLVVLFSRQVASANNLLLLHLGGLDILLGIAFLAFSAPGLSRAGWLSSGFGCSIHGFVFTLLHPLVLWTICGLNADRYYAIAAPLHYGHLVNPKKVYTCLAIGWAIFLVLSIPPLFSIAPFTYNSGFGACIPDFTNGKWVLWYSAAYTAFTLLLPVTLIVCCNVKILMIARYHRHRIASAIYEVTLSAQVTITHQRNPFFVPTITAPTAGGPRFRSRSPVSTVLQLLGSFLILYLPFYGIIIWEASLSFLQRSQETRFRHMYYQIVLTVLTCSPTINGFLYGLRNKTLRKTFQNYWRKKITKSEVNHEIQARTPSTCGSRRQSLTPLGFFTRPNIPRRLSEALLDVHKAVSPSKQPKMKRIASEMTWRQNSTSCLSFSPTEGHKKLPQTSSCNTLQVPKDNAEEVYGDEEFLSQNCIQHKTSLSSANLLLHKIFGIENKQEAFVQPSPKKSPRILITRALSDDSEKSSPHSPNREINKKLSSSTTLLEKRWRQIKYKDTEYDSDGPHAKTIPLLDKSSDSSEASDASSGLYMNLDRVQSVDLDKELNEEQALLSWPKKNPWSASDANGKYMKDAVVNVQSHEIVL